LWSNLGVITKTDDYKARDVLDVEFMSSRTRVIKHSVNGKKYYVPYPETDKVMASMSFDLKFNNARWSLLRACALRIESFFNEECRNILSEYIQWIQDEFKHELESILDESEEFDFLTYNQVLTVYKTDIEIAELYLGTKEGLVFESEVQRALDLLGFN